VLEHEPARYIPDNMPRHPLVAVTATTRADDGVPRVRLSTAYVDALREVGLAPVVVPPASDPGDSVDALVAVLQGLVLSGGEDVDPRHYGAGPHAALGPVHAARDATELALIEAARARHLPVLAICRGIQVLNVALGGTLIQDLPSERPSGIVHDVDGPRGDRTHAVLLTHDSRLARAIGRDEILVNSFHHQAVDRLAGSLQRTASAPDGVTEAVETPATDAWWVVGIQWHPEDLVGTRDPWDRALFQAFADAVAATPPGGRA
jgi:putative glutamine amidotransferase